MVEKAFTWTSKLATTFFHLRLENQWLFKKKPQAWKDFRNILLQNGFPEEMTLDHMRKKWQYTYDCYRLAKKTKNKKWLYYKLFDKYLGKQNVLDKYSSWNDEWRLKLITAYMNHYNEKVKNEDCNAVWREVERELRSQNLPNDCCIQDLKGLWHYLLTTFHRKHRLVLKKGSETQDWPLYAPLLQYYENFDPNTLTRLETEGCVFPMKHSNQKEKKSNDNAEMNETADFQWTRDITETFIQIRLQHEWMFRERKWAWNDLQSIMTNEYGFPRTLTGRMLGHKWSSTYAEYQKAKATNNESWIYYNLFEIYLGESRIDPLRNWQEEWVNKLIYVRTELEKLFLESNRPYEAWREVERKLRRNGIPSDHTLLELPEIWAHITRTYRWKQKFAAKGMLNEVWPHYEAMQKYYKVKNQTQSFKKEYYAEIGIDCTNDVNMDDYEDDIKLFDLKQKMSEKCEVQDSNSCRCCGQDAGCVSLFEQYDQDGRDLAHKLKVICGVEVTPTDNLSTQICFNCFKELENAYKFRRKCLEVDKKFKSKNQSVVKIELDFKHYENDQTDHILRDAKIENAGEEETTTLFTEFDPADFDHDVDETAHIELANGKPMPGKVAKPRIKRNLMKKKKKYEYARMCEICGKKTKNMRSHMDTHAEGKLYKCDQCDKTFKFKSGLVIHKSSHNPIPKKTCDVCGKTFHILASYRKHYVYHANERKYSCETCGKCFNTKDILTVHMRMHTDERPFSCPECGKTFRTAGCVSRHKRIVHKTLVKI